MGAPSRRKDYNERKQREGERARVTAGDSRNIPSLPSPVAGSRDKAVLKKIFKAEWRSYTCEQGRKEEGRTNGALVYRG